MIDFLLIYILFIIILVLFRKLYKNKKNKHKTLVLPKFNQHLVSKVVYWKDKLENWKNGIDIPIITKHVVYQTSPIIRTHPKLGIYKEFFEEMEYFETQDFSKYKEYLFDKKTQKPINKYIAFNNLPYYNNNGISKCYLVIPPLIKKNNGKYRDYRNIYSFYKETTLQEQKDLWKNVALFIDEYMNMHPRHNKFYISLHGGSVAYLHVRICREPKYYNKRFLESLENI